MTRLEQSTYTGSTRPTEDADISSCIINASSVFHTNASSLPDLLPTGIISPSKARVGHLHNYAFATARGFSRILTLFDFTDDELEALLNVLVVPGARFGPCALELFGKGFALL